MNKDFCVVMYNCSCFSASGLTRHKAGCSEPPRDISARSASFTCDICGRTFTQQKYLNQHKGGRKCLQRQTFVNRTESLTLALTESPGSSSNATSTRINSSSDSELVRLTSDLMVWHTAG